jgi:hypothetical protein
VGPDRSEQWVRTEAQLRAALADARPAIDPDAARWVEEYLDHNELGLAMDAFVEAALASEASALPEGTLDHLRAASADMEGYQPEAWGQFVARFGGHS